MDIYPSTPKPQFLKLRHSRMLLAGIQGKSELDPRLKHSRVTPLGVASLHPQLPIFKGAHEGPLLHSPPRSAGEERGGGFVLFVTFVVNLFVLWSCCYPTRYGSASARFKSSPIPGRVRSGRSAPFSGISAPSKNIDSIRA